MIHGVRGNNGRGPLRVIKQRLFSTKTGGGCSCGGNMKLIKFHIVKL